MTVLPFPDLYTERETVTLLRLGSLDTLRRLRRRGEIHFTRYGGRVYHTGQHIRAFIRSKSSDASCPSEDGSPDESAISGSAANGAAGTCTSVGTIPLPDRSVLARLAQATFGKPS